MKENLQRITQKLLIIAAIFAITLGIVYYSQEFQNGSDLNQSSTTDTSFFAKNVRNQHLQQQESYKCIHDEVLEKEEQLYAESKQYFEEEQVFEQKGESISASRISVQQEGDDWKPIRIHFDFSNLAESDADIKKFIKKELIPAAGQFFQEFLKVKPLINPLTIDPYYLDNRCGLPDIKIPENHISKGIPNTDVVFYIHAVNNPKENFLAYASNCPQKYLYQLKSRRPTIGYFAMNLFYLTKHIREKDPMRKVQWIYTTIHEMTHSLVFSPMHFGRFLDKPLSTKKEGKFRYINDPKIKTLAQNYFNCNSAAGAPLEDEGGQGTAGAHWERKVFGNELMTGSSMYDSVISNFTASIFEISGWYQVNQDKVGTLTWGRQVGCSIFETECNSNQFCSISKDVYCSYDYSGLGSCQIDPLSDKCQYYMAYSNTHCNYPPDQIDKLINKFGGSTGYNARCWQTDLLKKKANKKVDSLCFESKCSYDNPSSPIASFKFGGNWYNCKQGQDQVKVKEGYTFNCPNIYTFCYSLSSCPDSCYGRGTCVKGECKCFQGFYGVNCSQVQ